MRRFVHVNESLNKKIIQSLPEKEKLTKDVPTIYLRNIFNV
jgi:hypothetical protein